MAQKDRAKDTGPQGKSISAYVEEVLAEKITKRWTKDEKARIVELGNELGELLLARIEGEDIDKEVLACHGGASKIANHPGASVTGTSVLNEAVGRYCSHVLRGLAP